MKVKCEVEEVDVEGDYRAIPGVQLTCIRCDHQTESCGTSSRSIRRCLVLMREECPQEEDNFYVAEGDDE